MGRREFPAKVRVAVIKRATRDDGNRYCEKCGDLAKRFQIDHVRPDGLLGEPTLQNAMLICEPCFTEKNKADTSAIAKAKRREAAHLGAKASPTRKIQSAPFARSEKQPAIEKAAVTNLGPSEIVRRYAR